MIAYSRVVLVIFLISTGVYAQTPGLIVDPATGAGGAAFDPNGDGYVSKTKAGFVASDQSESELAFTPMVFPSLEPTSDLNAGPNCGFSDFVDSGIEDPAQVYYNSTTNNWFFRFRVGKIAPNSKGYSVLIDTDQKFGNTGANADPNYLAGNPGFEIEINLQTNFGVYVYNIDGTTSPVLVASHAGHTHYQKSVALSTNCGDPDYFYDFYIPFSDITANFAGVTLATGMRMSITTQMNPQAAIGNSSLSDIGGINDAGCGGSLTTCANTIVTNYPPTTANATITQGDRSVCPTISSSILAGATAVSGTTTEASGTLIKVFKNGALVGAVTTSSSSWTLSGLSALVANDVITASATAPGKSESINNCSSVTVALGCTAPFNNTGLVTGNTKGVCGAAGAGLSGAAVNVYTFNGVLQPGSYTVAADGSFQWKCNTSNSGCNSGAGCLTNGPYYVTQKLGASCESSPVWICVGSTGAAATPVITTNPILTSTTSLTGTAVASSTVYIYKNGTQIAVVTATAGGAWSATITAPAIGDVITVQAVSSSACLSTAASRTVTGTTAAPTITGTYCTATTITSVSGYSTAPAGTVIQVYSNAVAVGSTTTVNANGTWTASTGISIAPGAAITARATTTGWAQSAASNSITVTQRTTNAVAITTSPIIEATTTTISGTGTNGDVVKLYIDGTQVVTTATVASGTWTISGIAASDLYAGASVYATATTSGRCEGASSSTVTVQCITPTTSNSVSPTTSTLCSGSTLNVSVGTQASTFYQLFQGATAASTAILGTGSPSTITSSALTTSGTLSVKATKLYGAACTSTLSTTIASTINPVPTTSLTVAAVAGTLCAGSATTITVASSQSGFSYQLRNNADNSLIGSPVAGTGGTISLPTGNLTATTTFNVLATGISPTFCSAALSTTPSVTVNPYPSTPSPSSNTPVCAGNALNLSVAAVTGATYAWTGPNSFASSLQNPSIAAVTVAATGTYSLTVTVNGCTSSAGTTAVVIGTPLSTPSPSSNSPVCSGNTLNLTVSAIAGASYSWTGPNGFTSSLRNPSIASVTTAAAGTYSLTISANGCTSPSGSTSVVIGTPLATPVPSSNSPVCAGGTLTLSTAAVVGATYSWTGPNGFSASVQNPSITSVTTAASGSYSVSVSALGCTSSAGTTNVTIGSPLGTPSITTNSPVCAGGTLNLSTSAVAGATYSWTGPNGFTSSVQNPSLSNVTTAQGGVYALVVSANGCTSPSGSAAVTIGTALSAPSVSSDSPVCASGTLHLGTTAVAGATYSWSGPNGYTSTSQNPSIASITSAGAGVYQLSVSLNGCVSPTSTTTVTVGTPLAVPVVNSNSPVCQGGTLSLSTTATGVAYAWVGPNGFASTVQNPTINPVALADGGVFTLTISSNGCSNTASTSVVVNPTPVFTSLLTGIRCSNTSGTYIATSSLPNTSFSWIRAVVPGISNGAASANSNVATETLVNTADSSIDVVYAYTLTVNGCSTTQNVTITVTKFEYYWTGATNTDWFVPTNWACGTVPTPTTDAIIPDRVNDPIISTSGTAQCKELVIDNGATVFLQPNALLEVYGNWSNAGTFSSSTGTVVFAGNTDALLANTSTSSKEQFYNATINKSAAKVSFTANVDIKPLGTLLVQSGTLDVTSGDTVTLKSVAPVLMVDQTARLGKVTGVLSPTSVFAVERFIASPAPRLPYTTSILAPVIDLAPSLKTLTAGQWTDDIQSLYFASSSTSTIATYHEPSTVGFSYDERVKRAWSYVVNDATALTVGLGYKVIAGIDGNNDLLKVVGFPQVGSISRPVTYTFAGTQGWNLLGNPYPCEIDWVSLYNLGGNSSILEPNLYLLDPYNQSNSNSTYFVYQATTGLLVEPRSTSNRSMANGKFIASSQGFFVKAIQAGTVLFDESIKPSSPYTALYANMRVEQSTSSYLKIQVSDSNASAQAIVHFREDATPLYDPKYDAECFSAGPLNLYTYSSGRRLSINGLSLGYQLPVPLVVSSSKKGTKRFTVPEISSPSPSYFLVDNYTHKQLKLESGTTYAFDLNDDTLSTSPNRFQIREELVTSIETDDRIDFDVHPNPYASGLLTLRLPDGVEGQVEIWDMNGREVYSKSHNQAGTLLEIDLTEASLGSGVYTIKCTNRKRTFFKSLVIVR